MKFKSFLNTLKNIAYLFLLPVFFVLHGFLSYFGLVFWQDAFRLLFEYIMITALLVLVFRFIFKSWNKSAIFVFVCMSYNFFFGSFHDRSKNLLGRNFITSYSFILSVSAILFILLFLYLGRRKSSFTKFARYCNLLLVLFIIIDSLQLTYKIIARAEKKTPSVAFNKCDTCLRPDVFYIVPDEYAGDKELKTILKFDNSSFEDSLIQRGFHIIKDSKSNYNSTPFSVASTLNMDYLRGVSNNSNNVNDIRTCYDRLNHNAVVSFFKSSGYEVVNNSIFTFDDIPTTASLTLFPIRGGLISGQTLVSRIYRDLGFNLITRLHMKSVLKKFSYGDLKSTNEIYNSLLGIVKEKSEKPRFVYTHLMMPHYPYYFDKNGNPYPLETLLRWNQVGKKEYLGYLQYCNNKFIGVIDSIFRSAGRQAIIIFTSDHGFRHFFEPVDIKYHFMNLNAIYLPDGKYDKFYNGMSNVNLFRVLLNIEFAQQLPMLKDSSLVIR